MEIEKSVDLGDAMWNSSRTENTIIDSMNQGKDRVKSTFEPCNKLYTEMKKNSIPLTTAERHRILYP